MVFAVDEDVKLLQEQIRKLGTPAADGSISVKFGTLFMETEDIFEALSGTLRAAKKRKLITFKGELLLQGMHDNEDIVLLPEAAAPPPVAPPPAPVATAAATAPEATATGDEAAAATPAKMDSTPATPAMEQVGPQ